MKVCITGGAGFIASYFYPALRAAGHETVLLDLVEPTCRERGGARWIRGDIRDPKALAEAFGGCGAILHLAAAHHDFGIAYDEYFSVNEGGAKAICQAADACGIRNICFYSSVAVFGDAPEPRTEETEPLPTSPYGLSKLAGEKVFRQWTESGGGRTCLVIRPTVTFGPRNFANMYSLIRQIYRKRFLPVGDGSNVKSLSYVENIVQATLHLWNLGGEVRFSVNRPSERFDIYNYIDKPDLTSRQIVNACYEALGRRPSGLRIPLGLAVALGLPFDAVIKLTGKNLPISTSRIKKLCTPTRFEADKVRQQGFVPPVPLTEGIRRMVEWYVAEGRLLKPTGPGGAQ